MPKLSLPMVAPQDIGKKAAELLVEEHSGGSITYVEGPQMYSSQDVADSFGEILQKRVKVKSIPKDQWIATLEKMGFSDAAATSMAAASRTLSRALIILAINQ